MKKADKIEAVKADIRRLKSRRRYIQKVDDGLIGLLWCGITDAIATLEKYLKKIERKI